MNEFIKLHQGKYPGDEIQETFTFMAAEGIIYSTTDDFHFAGIWYSQLINQKETQRNIRQKSFWLKMKRKMVHWELINDTLGNVGIIWTENKNTKSINIPINRADVAAVT